MAAFVTISQRAGSETMTKYEKYDTYENMKSMNIKNESMKRMKIYISRPFPLYISLPPHPRVCVGSGRLGCPYIRRGLRWMVR
jgi:hypothetical protein